MTVSFLDLGAAYRELKAELDAAMARVMASGWYILGPEVESFESEYAAFVGAKHCVGVGNGLDALTLSLAAASIGPGDEVLVPSNTYIATWLAVTHVGARPIPVEPDPRTYNIDPARVPDAMSSRTRAIMAVHLYGRAAPCHELDAIAREHGLRLFDDAAQAHGVRIGPARVGGLTDATGWSFYPGKNLGAFGDAGAITTNDDELARKARMLRNYGSQAKYHNECIGWNSRLDPIQAAALRVKLRHLDAWNARRRLVATTYLAGLADLDWITLPEAPVDDEHVWHLFVVRSRHRDALQRHLAASGIQTLVHYPIPPHLQPAYRALGLAEGVLPISESIHREVLSLPMGPHLSLQDAQRVVDAVRAFAP